MMAIFTEEVAFALLERGFKLVDKTEFAWIFEDSDLLEAAVTELVDLLT